MAIFERTYGPVKRDAFRPAAPRQAPSGPVSVELADKEFLLADKAPEKRQYAHDMAALRRRHEDALLLGTFLDDEGVVAANGLVAKRFRGEEEEVLVIWNDSDEERLPNAKVDGYEIVSLDGVEGEVDKSMPMPPQSLLVATLKAI